jgi:predicted metal-dependent peptidase
LPAGLGRTVEEVIHPPADWRSVLREFVATHARNDYSWSRPNRRFLAQGLYLPGLYSEELGEVVLAIDTSGSIDRKMLGDFAVEVNAVLASYDCSVTVLYHDTEVERVQSEIESALAGIKIIVETIAPWKKQARGVRVGPAANIESAQLRR